jgi:hypothetical protein
MTTLTLPTALQSESRPTPTWLIFCVAGMLAMLFATVLDAIMVYGWPFVLRQGAGASPGKLVLATSILVQPITLAGRTALIALLAQSFLLVAGVSLGFRVIFRCALIASFASLVQLFLVLVPIFQHHDLAHLNVVPGSLNALMPGVAASPIWSPLGRVLTVLELAWIALFYVALRRSSEVSTGKLVSAVGGTWLVSILLSWALGLMPYALGLAPAAN